MRGRPLQERARLRRSQGQLRGELPRWRLRAQCVHHVAAVSQDWRHPAAWSVCCWESADCGVDATPILRMGATTLTGPHVASER